MSMDAVAPAAFPDSGFRDRLKGRVEQSLRAEENAGRLLTLKGRTAALLVIMVLVGYLAPPAGILYYEILIALFILLGFAAYWLERSYPRSWWLDYLFSALDSGLLAFTLIYPTPTADFVYPPQLALHFGNFVYFYIPLAALAMGFRPERVLWGGAMGALAWAAGVAWLVSLPDTVLLPTQTGGLADQLQALANPHYVDLDPVIQNIVVYLTVAGLLALIVARSRRLVERQMLLERERSNLARYFPPATVDRLAAQDGALAQIREADAAVLFFDLVGFTRWAESHAPAEVIRMLREVHTRVESAVFAHSGTLDKFIGDGAMATFGAIDAGTRQATDALACAVAIVEELEAWNANRRAPIRASVGVHYGPIVIGDVGTDRRMELAALGDTVNVASRLEALTREIKCGIVISAALASASKEETGAEAASLLAKFRAVGSRELRGRDETVEVLAYG